jgi:hypothetical protein
MKQGVNYWMVMKTSYPIVRGHVRAARSYLSYRVCSYLVVVVDFCFSVQVIYSQSNCEVYYLLVLR